MSNLLLSILWFTFLYGGTFFVFRKQNLFSPIRFIALLYLLRNVSYLIILYFDPEIFPSYVLRAIGMDLNESLVQYSYVQTIAFFSLAAGILLIRKQRVKDKLISFEAKAALEKTSIVLFVIAIGGYFIFLLQVGGIYLLLSSLENRVQLQSGSYSLILTQLLPIATIIRLKIWSIEKNRRNKYFFFFFLIFSVLMSSSLGGRKDAVFLILMSLIGYHFYIQPIRLRNMKFIHTSLLVFFITFYTFIIPILRTENGFEKLVNGEIDPLEQIDLKNLVGYFSYTYIDILTANYFDYNNKWNFSSLLTIPQNLNFFKESNLRPPIDEGYYLYNISLSRSLTFTPPTPRHKMYPSSLPIENFGFGYANFLVPGVIISFFLLGIIYRKVYEMFLSNPGPFFLYFYLFVIFNFNFSSLRIMNLIYLLINLGIAYLLYNAHLYRIRNL